MRNVVCHEGPGPGPSIGWVASSPINIKHSLKKTSSAALNRFELFSVVCDTAFEPARAGQKNTPALLLFYSAAAG